MEDAEQYPAVLSVICELAAQADGTKDPHIKKDLKRLIKALVDDCIPPPPPEALILRLFENELVGRSADNE